MKKNSKRAKTIQRILKTGMPTEMIMKITGHVDIKTVIGVYVDSDCKIDDKLLKMKQGVDDELMENKGACSYEKEKRKEQ